MKDLQISLHLKSCQFDELSALDQELVTLAKRMTDTSYSPYSHFRVGAAIRMQDGRVFLGSNQENASFPVGLCAERNAFFAASANAPEVAPVAVAIAARNENGFLPLPTAPCGMCRQALMEAEIRFHQPMRVILYGEKEIYICNSMQELLPLHFEL